MKNLKKLRLMKDLNQSDLAKVFNVSPNTVGRWENGEREPDNDTLKKIASYFNVTVDYLIGNTDAPNRMMINDGVNVGWVQVIDAAIQTGLTPEDIKELIEIAGKYRTKGIDK